MIADAPTVKACCAAAYGSEAVRWLLGDRLHPGGAELTAHLIAALRLAPGRLLADVACGTGASAIQAATQTGCDVVGLDLAPANVELAGSAAVAAGLRPASANGESAERAVTAKAQRAETAAGSRPAEPARPTTAGLGRARFAVADAEALPLPDASVDAVLCECALCTFPDKRAAAGELARVLRPGGRLALSDVTADPARLPAELRSLDAWIACIGDARPLAEVSALLTEAGLVVEHEERHDDALEALVDRAEARLRLARVLGSPLAGSIDRGIAIAAAARRALADQALGYGVVIASRP